MFRHGRNLPMARTGLRRGKSSFVFLFPILLILSKFKFLCLVRSSIGLRAWPALGIHMQAKLILASASIRRRKILTAMGVAFEVVIPQVAEVIYARDARRTARENAARKSAWCRTLYSNRHSLAADTLRV